MTTISTEPLDMDASNRIRARPAGFVHDVQNGYNDRLLLTPIRRLSILLGHMIADVAAAAALTIPILVLGFVLGVRFESGPLGVIVFVALAASWSLAFAGFGVVSMAMCFAALRGRVRRG